MFKKYPKVYALHKDENIGFLEENQFILVQEKIDGANTSIWMEDGELKMASRNKEVTEGFRGFCDYVRGHKGIRKMLTDYSNLRLYGEWLVSHTIKYDETAYGKFYLFDIYDDKNEEFMSVNNLQDVAKSYGMEAPYSELLQNPTIEEIMERVGKSQLGEKGEGVVLKAEGWKNQFGDHSYAKIVTQEFKEDNGIVFGGNNKHSDTYNEMYFVNKFATLERTQKVMNKVVCLVDEKLDKKHTPQIIKTCYHDMVTEHAWEMASSKKKVDFAQLQRLAMKKFARIYHDILREHISVAYKTDE